MMRRMYRTLLSGSLKMVSAGLGWLAGISGIILGCFPAPAYGMPYAEYKVSGTVTSESSGQPIPGIMVSRRDTLDFRSMDSVTTDPHGRYVLSFSENPWNGTWVIRTEDIDGAENGAYAPKDSVISIKESSLSGGDGSWNAGKAERVVHFRLNDESGT